MKMEDIIIALDNDLEMKLAVYKYLFHEVIEQVFINKLNIEVEE